MFWDTPTDIAARLSFRDWELVDSHVTLDMPQQSWYQRGPWPAWSEPTSLASPQLQIQRRLVQVILQGRSLMLSDAVTSAFDAALFNKHDANKYKFALILSLLPTARVFEKCTNIMERLQGAK